MFIILSSLFIGFSSFAGVVSEVPLGCGYSDSIFSQIPQWTHEKSAFHYSLRGQQGESGRRFLMYSDQSWILTFEFLSKNDPKYDLSCIVRTGPGEEAYDSMTAPIQRLPTKRIGEPLRAEDEARLQALRSKRSSS